MNHSSEAQEPVRSINAAVDRIGSRIAADVLRPIQAFRLSYLPPVMIYFAYGATGLVDVSRDMWIKERLALTPAELAGIGVWLALPWTIKMVFGEMVDSVPIFRSQRRSYILIGAAMEHFLPSAGSLPRNNASWRLSWRQRVGSLATPRMHLALPH